MPIRAALFDFDGLIVDTESVHFEAWRETYRTHGAELTPDAFRVCIGTSGAFDPVAHLQEIIGRRVDADGLRHRTHQRVRELLDTTPVREGIGDWIEAASGAGLRLGVASNSSGRWVRDGLARVGLLDSFEAVVGCDDAGGHHKPSPAVYLEALRRLGAGAPEAVAIEDSLNGVRSAKAAGMWCVAVPGPLTLTMDFSEADLVVERPALLTFEALLARAA